MLSHCSDLYEKFPFSNHKFSLAFTHTHTMPMMTSKNKNRNEARGNVDNGGSMKCLILCVCERIVIDLCMKCRTTTWLNYLIVSLFFARQFINFQFTILHIHWSNVRRDFYVKYFRHRKLKKKKLISLVEISILPLSGQLTLLSHEILIDFHCRIKNWCENCIFMFLPISW